MSREMKKFFATIDWYVTLAPSWQGAAELQTHHRYRGRRHRGGLLRSGGRTAAARPRNRRHSARGVRPRRRTDLDRAPRRSMGRRSWRAVGGTDAYTSVVPRPAFRMQHLRHMGYRKSFGDLARWHQDPLPRRCTRERSFFL